MRSLANALAGPATGTLGSRIEDVGHRERRLKWDFGQVWLKMAKSGRESRNQRGYYPLHIGGKEGLPKVKYLPRGILKFCCISESPGRAFSPFPRPHHAPVTGDYLGVRFGLQ